MQPDQAAQATGAVPTKITHRVSAEREIFLPSLLLREEASSDEARDPACQTIHPSPISPIREGAEPGRNAGMGLCKATRPGGVALAESIPGNLILEHHRLLARRVPVS